MDLSRASDQELADELVGARKYYEALVGGATLDGRENGKQAEMVQTIAAIESEIEKRNAHRT